MKNSIEIKIECKGFSAGTLGWFNSIIEKSELVIKNCEDSTPAMFLKTPTSNGKFKYKFIVGVWVKKSDPEPYNTNGILVYIRPENMDYYNGGGFSDYKLTPACYNKVDEFIDMAVEKFNEWWNEN